MTDRSQRRVVCAAIRAEDGTLLLGIRHYSGDMHSQMLARMDGGEKFRHRYGDDQGFVDQRGIYMTREEAYKVAEAAGQIFDQAACREGKNGMQLYSEGLY